MHDSFLIAFLRPFALFAVTLLVLRPCAWLVWRYMRDSRLKRLLLTRLH
jgi:hypothetical protein